MSNRQSCACAACGAQFLTISQFDAHMLADHEPRPVLRTIRRTSRVTVGPDIFELCEPECRDEVLLDLGLKGSGGGSAYPAGGEASAGVAWNQKTYAVSWRRQPRASARFCDMCGEDWRFRARVGRRLSDEQRRELADRMRELRQQTPADRLRVLLGR